MVSNFVEGFVPFLIEWGVKGTVVLAAGGLVSVLMRRRRAAERHALWAAVLAGVLIVPLLGLVLPGLHLPERSVAIAGLVVRPLVEHSAVENFVVSPIEPLKTVNNVTPLAASAVSRDSTSSLNISFLMVVAWMLGAALVAGRYGLGAARFLVAARRAAALDTSTLPAGFQSQVLAASRTVVLAQAQPEPRARPRPVRPAIPARPARPVRERENETPLLPETMRAVVTALTEALKSSDVDVRKEAAEALGHAGRGHPEAIDALVEAMDDADPRVQREVLESLGMLIRGSDKAPNAVAGMVSLLQHSDSGVRKEAAQALGHAGVANPTVIEALSRALDDSEASVRNEAMDSLGQLARNENVSAADAVAIVGKGIKSTDPNVRKEAVEALGNLTGRRRSPWSGFDFDFDFDGFKGMGPGVGHSIQEMVEGQLADAMRQTAVARDRLAEDLETLESDEGGVRAQLTEAMGELRRAESELQRELEEQQTKRQAAIAGEQN